MPPKRKTYIKNCTGLDCEVEKKNTRNLFLRVSFYFLSVVFLCLLAYMLFFSVEMQINKIEINNNKELNKAELEQIVENEIQGKFIGIFPKNNYILASKNNISETLVNKYKKIRSVKVEKKFPGSISVSIDEHESLLVWCKVESQCYLLDEEGVAYNVADFNSPELQQNKLVKLSDSSNAEVSLGSKIMEKEYEEYLLKIKSELEKINISIEDNFLTPSRMAEEIEVRSVNGFRINFSTQFSLESAMKTLSAVLKKEIPKEKINELEYVDLRSEYKAFYKYKNVEVGNDEDEKGDGVEVEKKNEDEK